MSTIPWRWIIALFIWSSLATPPVALAQETVATADAPMADEPEADPAGPGAFGQRGLWRTWAAEPYDFGAVVAGISSEYAYSTGLLTNGDKNQRLANRLVLAGVPVTGLELALGLSLVVNNNPDFEPDQVQTLGDPSLSLRYGHPVTDWLAIGGGVQAVFPSGRDFSELSADGISTRVLIAMDFTPLPALLVTLNAGYHFDNSSRIFDYPLNAAQQFGAGINPHDQALVGLGLAYQVGPVAPFVEYGAAVAIGSGAPGFADCPGWLTIGLRAWPLGLHNLHLTVGADIGLTGVSGVPEGKARIPRWNLLLAAGFNFGELPPPEVRIQEKIKIVEKRVEVPTPVEVAKPQVLGRIVGRVVDAKTDQPLGNAVVSVTGKGAGRFVTDPEQGRFRTCLSEPGPAKLTVSLPGYREETQAVLIGDQPETPVTVSLTASTGKTYGTLKGSVRSAAGKPLPALISIPARKLRKRAKKRSGGFKLEQLETGTFDVLISMPRYVTQRRKIKLRPGDIVILNVELDPKR